MDRHDANKEEQEEKEKKKECGTRHSSEHTAVSHEDDENKRNLGCVTREGWALDESNETHEYWYASKDMLLLAQIEALAFFFSRYLN